MKQEFKVSQNMPGIDFSILVASIGLNLLSLVLPLGILMIFDRVIPFQSGETLAILGLVLVATVGLEFVLRWSRSTLLGFASERSAIHNSATFLNNTLNANTRRFAAVPAAVNLERYSAISQVRDYQSGQHQALAIDLPFTAVFLVTIALIGGWLVLVPLATLVGVLLFAGAMRIAQKQVFDKRKSLDLRRYAFLSEVFANLRTVKANTMERQMSRRFELLRDQSADCSQQTILFSGFAQSFGAVFSQLSISAMGILGAYFVINNTIGIAELAACMLLNGRITQPLMKLISYWVQSESFFAATEKLGEMTKLSEGSVSANNIPKLRGLVEVSDLVLEEPNSDLALAGPFGFRAAPGDFVLFNAPDARVFPALVDVIAGQRVPRRGRVMIDGYLAQDRVRQRGKGGIAFLEDEPAIFTGTLIDNMCAFGDANDVDRAKKLAAELGLEDRVHRLPLGYDTFLEGGSEFEKDPVNRQLISLVRVLSLNARLIMMNEPSSILNNQMRDRFASCLQRLENKPTILLTSPDPRLKKLATQIVPLFVANADLVETWAEMSGSVAMSDNSDRGAVA